MSERRSFRARVADAVRSFWVAPFTSSSGQTWWGSAPTRTGISIDEQTALTYSAVWAAVNLISSQTASLPLILYKRLKDGGKERFNDHNLYQLLHDAPNSEMSSMVLRETMQAHVLTWGNAYAEIVRDGAGRPRELWPITPDRVQPYRLSLGTRMELQYRVTDPSGGQVTIPADDMLHVPGLGFDGLLGYSVVSKARESIGLGLAMERFGATFFGNGSSFGGVLTYPGNLTKEVKQAVRESIDATHTGVERAHKFLLLGGGPKYERLGIPPDDAQFLQSRTFQILEICRWFQMPPHKMREMERATFGNIEHQSIEFLTDTLRQWLVRWEQEINRKLIAPVERRIQFVEHLVDGLSRGDQPSRYAAYAVGRQWGWLSADDIRIMENLNPLPNGAGKIYLVPLNMAPADRLTQLVDAQIKSKKTSSKPLKSEGQAAARAIAAVRAALTEAEQRAEAHAAQAAAFERQGTQWQADCERERAAAQTAIQEAAGLRATLVLTQEQIDRERALLEAEQAARAVETAGFAAAAGQVAVTVEAATVRAVAAETDLTTSDAELTAARGDLAAVQARITALETAQAAERAAAGALTTAAETANRAEVDTLRAELAQATSALETARQAVSEATQRAEQATEHQRATAVTVAQQSDARRQQLTAMIAAQRSLIEEAMSRVVRKETDRARKQQATPQKLRAWLEPFYATHTDLACDTLLPAIRVHLAWQQSATDAVTRTRTVIEAHVAESVRQLRAVLDGTDPDEFHVVLERTLTRWETERPAQLADTLLTEAIDHVRHLA